MSYAIWHLHISVKCIFYFNILLLQSAESAVAKLGNVLVWDRTCSDYLPICAHFAQYHWCTFRLEFFRPCGGLCAWLLYFLMENPIGSHFTCTNNMGRKIPQVFIFLKGFAGTLIMVLIMYFVNVMV